MNDVRDLINKIEGQLAEDEKQLAAFEQQADAVAAAYADLMKRLRVEIEATAGARNGTWHLRG